MSEPWTTSASATLGGDRRRRHARRRARRSASRSPSGEIDPGFPHGLFFRDTRFLSELRLRVNGRWPESLAATTTDPVQRGVRAARTTRRPVAPTRTSWCSAAATSGAACAKTSRSRNFGEEPAFCSVEIALDADFADLFEVKEGRVEKRGELGGRARTSGRVTFAYRRGALPPRRRTSTSPRAAADRRRARRRYEVIVPAARRSGRRASRSRRASTTQEITPRYLCGQPVERSTPVARLEEWRRRLPVVTQRPRPVRRAARAVDARTSPRCASSIPSIPTAPSSPRARRGS